MNYFLTSTRLIGGGPVPLSSAAAAAGALVFAGDGGVAGRDGRAVADRDGDADLLGQGHGAHGAVGIGGAGDGGAALAGDGGGAHDRGGGQEHSGGHIHALGADLVAAVHGAGIFGLIW